MKKTVIALSLATMTLPALAQDKKAPEPDYTISGNLGITSDYRFRGISQSDNRPAVQGGVDFAHKSGLYVGNWNSSVSTWTAPSGAGIEMDFYGGFKTELFGIGLDLGAIYYYYPGAEGGLAANPQKNTYNTQEAYVGVSYGPVSFKTSYVLGDNYFGLGKDYAIDRGVANGLSQTKDVKGTLYYDLSLAYEIAPKVTIKAHAGLLDVKNATSWGITDYSLGLSYALADNWAVNLMAMNSSLQKNAKDDAWFEDATNNGTPKKLYGSKVAVSLTKTF